MPTSRLQVDVLWAEVFGEPPAINASPEMLIEILVQCLAQAPPYTGFAPAPADGDHKIRATAAAALAKRHD